MMSIITKMLHNHTNQFNRFHFQLLITFNVWHIANRVTQTFIILKILFSIQFFLAGNFIVTLECSRNRRQNNKISCRVYTNWNALDSNVSGCYNTAIRARIADKVTPTNTTKSNCLEVIELPLKDVVAKEITCCQVRRIQFIPVSSEI